MSENGMAEVLETQNGKEGFPPPSRRILRFRSRGHAGDLVAPRAFQLVGAEGADAEGGARCKLKLIRRLTRRRHLRLVGFLVAASSFSKIGIFCQIIDAFCQLLTPFNPTRWQTIHLRKKAIGIV